jgi:hypothetical protein
MKEHPRPRRCINAKTPNRNARGTVRDGAPGASITVLCKTRTPVHTGYPGLTYQETVCISGPTWPRVQTGITTA